MKAPTPGLLIRLLDSASPYWKGTPSLRVCVCVCVCVCSRCKSVKYSRGEGCSINLATPTFFNLDWQVNCRGGNILSSSRFLSIALRSRVALHHVCRRGLYWRTLRPDWMPGTHTYTHTHTHTHTADVCVERGCVWRLPLRVEVEWLYWICGHLGFFVANKPCPQSNSSNCFKKMKTIKVQVLHSGAAVNTSVLSDSSDRHLALNSSIFFQQFSRGMKKHSQNYLQHRNYNICCRLRLYGFIQATQRLYSTSVFNI